VKTQTETNLGKTKILGMEKAICNDNEGIDDNNHPFFRYLLTINLKFCDK